MARTRSAHFEKQEEVEESSDAAPSPENEDIQPPPPPSFNGRLSRFHYASTTSTSITSPSTSTKPSASPLPSRRTPKRALASPNDAFQSASPTSTTSSPRPKKKRKPSSYAPPSKYAHLSPLTDILEPNLICVFVGTNPGVRTATAGHAYAHPSNLFWKLLHSSGLTDRRLSPTEDVDLPRLYCMGNTNIVSRPSKDAAELSKAEMEEGAGVLEEKFRIWKPEAVCIVGKGIWESIWRAKYGRNPKGSEFKYGWQEERENMGKSREGGEEKGLDGKVWRGSKVFVATSTSGLAASLRPAEKEAIWKPFGEWVQERREERGFVPRDKGEGVVQEQAVITGEP